MSEFIGDITDGSEPSADHITLTLLAAHISDGFTHSSGSRLLDALEEEVIQAMFAAAHEGLEAIEGFKRYGDIGPDEDQSLRDLAHLIIRSVLANGRIS